MVTLELDVIIDDFVAGTDSIIELYLNEDLLYCLDCDCRKFKCKVIMDSPKNNIVLKRKYKKERLAKKNDVMRRTTSSLLALLLMANLTIEPFECPYECEETLKICINGESPKMTIFCVQNEDDRCPQFNIDTYHCSFSSHKIMLVSSEELNDWYIERKKLIYMFFSFATFLLMSVFVLALVHNNLTTSVFLTIIESVFLICTIFSLKNLKKEYLRQSGDGSRTQGRTNQSGDGSVIDKNEY